jgi:hypothetical protein
VPGVLFSSDGCRRAAALAGGLLLGTTSVSAQLDPTLFLKRTTPRVLLLVDVAERMQRDAPIDPTQPDATSNYYDPFIYTRTGAAWEATIGVSAASTAVRYRRRYGFRADGSCPLGGSRCGLVYEDPGSGDRFGAGAVAVTTDRSASYASWEAPTRLAVARAALYYAVNQNRSVARFGLIKMRQTLPAMPVTAGNAGPVVVDDPAQAAPTDAPPDSNGRWRLSRPTVSGSNGTADPGSAVLVKADAAAANADVLTVLSKAPGDAPSGSLPPLVPAGNDDAAVVDAPVNNLLLDARAEAIRLVSGDDGCTTMVAVLVVGGGEGTTSGRPDTAATAASFLGVAGRRIPIYVLALAPPADDVAGLQAIASRSGGGYFEITSAHIEAALASPAWSASATGGPDGTVVVPEAVRAINTAIQAAFRTHQDLNTNSPSTSVPEAPVIPASEFQASAPVVGTVNLKGVVGARGDVPGPEPDAVLDRTGSPIPQRSNLMITTGFTLPGFDGMVRAFRVYAPVRDAMEPSGWRFQADGTKLWTARAPDPASRNLFTTLADGAMIPLTVSNAPLLAPLMNLSTADASTVIDFLRRQPIGAVLDSTPAILSPPSLGPPDDAYLAFAAAHRDRRAVIFVGTHRGVLEALDARTGMEVWGYVPMNLLPKLRALWTGQAIGATDFLMNASAKIADIRTGDGAWRTYLFVGQGAGGTFYQAIDVTLTGMGSSVPPTDDDVPRLLAYFSEPYRMPLKWSFPSLSEWDPAISNAQMPYGDLKATAREVVKTVGQTWSHPAIGQVAGDKSPHVAIVGSGFLPYSTQQQPNRGGVLAGTTLYLLAAEDGALLDSKDVGSDGVAETQDNCVSTNDCTRFKNALQSDPVGTGPSTTGSVTGAYIADLDGRIWRFDLTLDASSRPAFRPGSPAKVYEDPARQPFFSSMATVRVGGARQYLVAATGHDLLPGNGVSQQYRLLGVLDGGGSGTTTFEIDLARAEGSAGERVTAFPAVAGDIAFFTTTTLEPGACTLPRASLYAVTFAGGAAYDTNSDGRLDEDAGDSVLVSSIVGARATAPFTADRHLVFGVGRGVVMSGDPDDYNGGAGRSGVRILSWRQGR